MIFVTKISQNSLNINLKMQVIFRLLDLEIDFYLLRIKCLFSL